MVVYTSIEDESKDEEKSSLTDRQGVQSQELEDGLEEGQAELGQCGH